MQLLVLYYIHHFNTALIMQTNVHFLCYEIFIHKGNDIPMIKYYFCRKICVKKEEEENVRNRVRNAL